MANFPLSVTTVSGKGSALNAVEFDSNLIKTRDCVNDLNERKADKSDLTSHTTNTNNPHNVTAAQLGAANILAQIKTVDGAGSGLDADLLDGNDSSFYRNASNINAGTLSNDRLSSQVYTQSNILGTVSQSGGVPTGAIIQRGSNANGEYVKYADGTMICNIIVDKENFMTEDTFSTTVQGIIWYRSKTYRWTFPHSFIYPPNIQITPENDISGSRIAISRIAQTLSDFTDIQLIGVEDFTEGSTGYTNLKSVRILAIGRWY